MDTLEMEEVSAHCSRRMTVEADTFADNTNLIYKHYKSIAYKFIKALKNISTINGNAMKSNHDTRDTTHTTYNVETSELPVDTSSSKMWISVRDRIIQFKDDAIKIFKTYKGHLLKRKGNSEEKSVRLEDKSESSKIKEFLAEADWFRTEFNKRVGAAPELASEDTVKQKLREQSNAQSVNAVQYYRHVPQPEPISVTSLAWPHPRGVIKCMCPAQKCVCSENMLQKSRSLPGSEWLWLKALFRKPCAKKEPLAKDELPKLLERVYAEMERDEEPGDEPKCTDPYLCFEGCHNFHYYDRSDLNTGKQSSVSKHDIHGDAVHSDRWLPTSHGTTQKNLFLDSDISDPVSTAENKRSVFNTSHSVSTRIVERDGKFVIARPSTIKYGQPKTTVPTPKTTVLRDWCGVELNVTLVSDAYDEYAASTSNTLLDRNNYNRSFENFPVPKTLQTDSISLCDLAMQVQDGCSANIKPEISSTRSVWKKSCQMSRKLLQRIFHWDPGKGEGRNTILKRLYLPK